MKEIIDVIKSFSGAQWAAIIAIITSGIYAYNWVEGRYAHRESVDRVLEHVIIIDSKISAIINTQYTPEQIAKINENSRLYEEQLRRYAASKKDKEK